MKYNRHHRHQHEYHILLIQCKELTEKVHTLQSELDSLHQNHKEHYENHANTLAFLQTKNAELHKELRGESMVYPVPPHFPYPQPRPKPPKKPFLDRDPTPNITEMPHINITPQPIKKPSKCFGYPYLNPYSSYYPYSAYSSVSPYYPYYRGELTQPPKKEYVPPAKPPHHDIFSDSDSDSD